MYYCELCDFSSPNRNNIHEHHIVPKELKGSNKLFNKTILCARCHSMIYVDGSKSGIHSIKNANSIIIKGWFQSTEGSILITKDMQGIENYTVKKNVW